MEPSQARGITEEVRDFLESLRLELPDVFAPRDQPAPAAPPSPAPGAQPLSRARIRELFEARVAHWSALMGGSPKRVFIKDQRSVWGSCSARGNLNFNWRLSLAPPEVLDYVVIHELAHLKQMNHSKAFWGIVAGWCPLYKERRRWLRENDAVMRRPLRPEAS